MLEDAQRNSLSTNLPLSNVNLLTTAMKPIFTLQEYPDESCKWERKSQDAKM